MQCTRSLGFRVKYLAFHDYISGLPNKQKFFLDTEAELNKAHQQDAPISLTLLSIDHIDIIEDKYGLEAPDATMKTLASITPKAFGRFSYAKLSDATIAILLIGLTLEQAAKLTESFRCLAEDQLVLMDEVSFNFTISAGIVQSKTNNINDLLRRADNRLHLAKENGGNTIHTED